MSDGVRAALASALDGKSSFELEVDQQIEFVRVEIAFFEAVAQEVAEDCSVFEGVLRGNNGGDASSKLFVGKFGCGLKLLVGPEEQAAANAS